MTDARSARQQLAARFYSDLLDDWIANGRATLARARKEDASGFVKVIATATRDFHVELNVVVDQEMAQTRTRAEVFDLVRARGGQRAVEALTLLIGHMDGDDGPSNVIALHPAEVGSSDKEEK